MKTIKYFKETVEITTSELIRHKWKYDALMYKKIEMSDCQEEITKEEWSDKDVITKVPGYYIIEHFVSYEYELDNEEVNNLDEDEDWTEWAEIYSLDCSTIADYEF